MPWCFLALFLLAVIIGWTFGMIFVVPEKLKKANEVNLAIRQAGLMRDEAEKRNRALEKEYQIFRKWDKQSEDQCQNHE